MLKNLLTILTILCSSVTVFAYQDCIIMSDGKLTDINIEDNTIVDITPVITVMNEKNTLMVHPLKQGSTKFCVLKNDKSLALFTIEVTELETIITPPLGFDVFTIDSPGNEIEFNLDEPPSKLNFDNTNYKNGKNNG